MCNWSLVYMHGLLLWNTKTGVSIVNLFQNILDNSQRKLNKIRVDQGSEFRNCQFKKLLKDNNIEMYSTYNEGKFLVAERSIKTLKTGFLNIWQLYQKMFILMF